MPRNITSDLGQRDNVVKMKSQTVRATVFIQRGCWIVTPFRWKLLEKGCQLVQNMLFSSSTWERKVLEFWNGILCSHTLVKVIDLTVSTQGDSGRGVRGLTHVSPWLNLL